MTMNKSYRWHNQLIMLAIGMLAGIYFLVAYWMFAPYKVVEISNVPIPMVNKDAKVRAGEPAQFHIISTKYMDIPAIVNRQLIDGCNIPIYSGYSNLPAGETNHIIRVFIPAYTPPGVYKMRTTYKYQVNPVRSITYTHESAYFEVVPR